MVDKAEERRQEGDGFVCCWLVAQHICCQGEVIMSQCQHLRNYYKQITVLIEGVV
jgi:hypothetical protein